MKKSIWTIVIVALIVAVVGSLTGVSLAFADGPDPVARTKTFRLGHISDNHVMIEEFCNPYSRSYAAGSKATGKMLAETEELTRRALEDIYQQALVGDAPMYVFDTGDLTSNGELANMVGVANILKEYTAKIRSVQGYEGFQIFVIPGNHDIYNQKAISYMPTPEDPDYQAFSAMSAEEKEEYLSSFGKTGVKTTTNLAFMTLFSDFGYCNCPDRLNGHHLDTCGMVDGCQLEFFYESDYWWEPGTTRSGAPVELAEPYDLVGDLDALGDHVYGSEYVATSGHIDAWTLEEGGQAMKDAVARFDASDKDFRLTAKYASHGACSYIARVGGLTVVGFDGDSRKFKALKDTETNPAMLSSAGWDETTGGVIMDEMMQWAFASLDSHHDADNGNLVVCLGHINILPHFDTEDEVISLFTYDNWEQLYTNLADHGVRYTFSGHQHAMDTEVATNQSGKVLYDFETGSLSSMGSGWRDLSVKQTWYESGAYSEDVATKINFMDFNTKVDGNDAFLYHMPRIALDGSLALQPVYEMNGDNYVGIDFALGNGLHNMITSLVHNYVNDGLYDMLKGMFSGLEGGSMDGIYQLLNSLVDQLSRLNLIPFIADEDGDFHMGAGPRQGYDLVAFANDFVGYLLAYDFSGGKVEGGMTLGDLLWQVYGGHLVGANADEIADNLLPTLALLENGDFLRIIEDLLYRGFLPNLELILSAPIYWGDVEYVRVDEDAQPVTRSDVTGGKGFDVSEYADSILNLSFMNGMINVGDIIKKYADVSSLKNLIRSVPNVLAGLKIVDEEGNVDYNSIMMGLIMELAGAKVGKYVGIAVDYINKIDQYPSLTLMIKEELLDKYVTLAFCKNIGNYGAYILRSMLLDDSPDGVKWDKDKLAAGNPFPFTVIATEDATAFKRGFFNVTPASLDGSNYLVDGVQHTYYRAADGSDTLTVVPSRDNGMIPSMITMTNVVDEEGKLDPTKRLVRWWTHFDVDVTDVNEEGISNAVHETFIQYGFEADALSSQIAVEGLNVSLEYPTIDLGITYINMTYAYREYNRYDFMFDNLLPNTTYYYRVGSNLTGWSQVYSFTTLPEEGGVEIVAISDIQGSVERNYQLSLFNMLKAFEQGNPQMVISMGDNVDKGENINQWGWLLNDHDVVYAQYAFETVAGNHEDDQECIAQVVKVGDQAYMSATGYYYSYNYQNLHMVYLNTNDLADDNTLGHEQLDWLEHDLAQASTDPSIEFIVVCLHKGPFTAGSHAFDTDVINLRAQLTPIFINYGVDLVLQGHDHTYSVSQYITGMEEIWDEDEEHVIGHKYSATAPQYDATGAAKDPEGVLFVNLGTMGDKFYNYIYSDEVLLKDRSKDYVNQLILADYFVDDKLELKPEYSDKGGVATRAEAPVYAYLKVQDGRLSLTTYTVINGISHVVDDIAITKSAASLDEELSFKVLGQTFTPDTLKDVEVVRFAVGRADGFTYYAGYRLADISDYEEYYANNKRYKVKDTYVALYSSKSAGEAGTKLDEPICMVYTPDGVRVVDIEAAQNLSWWAILLIVVGALIVAGAIVCMVLFVPGKNRKPIVDINAIRAKPQKFDNQELSKEESKEEEDIAELKEDGPKEDDAQ